MLWRKSERMHQSTNALTIYTNNLLHMAVPLFSLTNAGLVHELTTDS